MVMTYVCEANRVEAFQFPGYDLKARAPFITIRDTCGLRQYCIQLEIDIILESHLERHDTRYSSATYAREMTYVCEANRVERR
jgi:hypothetical protein